MYRAGPLLVQNRSIISAASVDITSRRRVGQLATDSLVQRTGGDYGCRVEEGKGREGRELREGVGVGISRYRGGRRRRLNMYGAMLKPPRPTCYQAARPSSLSLSLSLSHPVSHGERPAPRLVAVNHLPLRSARLSRFLVRVAASGSP